MSLPEQRPVRRPVPLRPRDDRPWLPAFPARPERREHAHPFEAYDPANEPRPLSWSELRDSRLWLEGGLAVAIGVIGLIVVLASGPQVTP